MRFASYLVLGSAALHVIGCLASGFSPDGLFLLGPALLLAGLGVAVMRRLRASGWISMILMLGSAAAAMAQIFGTSTVPVVVFWAILAVNLTAAVLLFAAIWVGPNAPEPGKTLA